MEESKTPLTDALQAEFNRDWQVVFPSDRDAVNQAARHADKAMAHARRLEQDRAELLEAMKRIKDTVGFSCGPSDWPKLVSIGNEIHIVLDKISK